MASRIFFNKHSRWLLPLFILILIAPFSTYLDLTISGWFYHNGKFSSDPYAQFFYIWGFYPADIVGLILLLLLIASFFFTPLKSWQKEIALLILTLAIGAGLIVHGILKDHWGRPRPVQITAFGGSQAFRPFYKPNFTLKSNFKSFPSGHSSVGFYFFTLMIIGQRRKIKSLKMLGLALGLFLGISLSYSRISMGGHFFTDALAAAFIMWWTALSINWLLYRRTSP